MTSEDVPSTKTPVTIGVVGSNGQMSSAALMECAREQWRSNQYVNAADTLNLMLARKHDHPGANALMAEVLVAAGRASEAGPYINLAIAAVPGNPRLHVLRGDCLRAARQWKKSEAAYLGALALDPTRAAPWSGRIAIAVARNQWRQAITLMNEALVVLKEQAGFWRNTVLQMHSAGAGKSALPPIPAVWSDADRAKAHALFADLLRQDGDFVSALAERRLAVAVEPGNRVWRRRLIGALLYCGELEAAEAELAALLQQSSEKDDLGPELHLLQEARIFQSAMNGLRAAQSAPPEGRHQLLARQVDEEPGCLFTAVAFLGDMRRAQLPYAAIENPDAVRAIPDDFWAVAEPAPGWREAHPQGQWRALGARWLQEDLRKIMPPRSVAMLMLPLDMRIDLLRFAVLAARGGWWYPAAAACHGSVHLLTDAGTALVLVCNEDGWLTTECIGCRPNDPAILAAQAVAKSAFDLGLGNRGSSRWHTGALPLTLGVAGVLAGRVLRGESLADVRILGESTFRRSVA